MYIDCVVYRFWLWFRRSEYHLWQYFLHEVLQATTLWQLAILLDYKGMFHWMFFCSNESILVLYFVILCNIKLQLSKYCVDNDCRYIWTSMPSLPHTPVHVAVPSPTAPVSRRSRSHFHLYLDINHNYRLKSNFSLIHNYIYFLTK